MGTTFAPVTPQDLASYADISDVTLSPDGSRIAVVKVIPDVDTNRYRRSVLVGLPMSGSLSVMDFGAPDATRIPQWSPDGDLLSVVVDFPGGCGIRVMDIASSVVHSLLDTWPDSIEELRWSPDGSKLLFVAREPTDREYWEIPDDRRPPLRLTELNYREDGVGWLVGRPRQAYILDVIADAPGQRWEASSPRKLSVGSFDEAEFSWHPDGQSVFYVSQRHEGRDRSPLNDIFQQPLDGAPRRITQTTHQFSEPRPSPDGSRLSCSFVEIIGYPAASHLAVVDVVTGELSDLAAELDRDCLAHTAIWMDAQTIACAVLSEGSIGVRRFDVANPGNQELLLGDNRQITAFDVRDGQIVAVESAPTRPPALVAGNLADSPDGATRRTEMKTNVLYDPNATIREDRSVGAPRHTAIEVAPGVFVDSWVVLPDREKFGGLRPVIVWLQGGGGQYGYQWSHELQVLVSAGFAVLYLNARGSGGYGTNWMRTVSGKRSAHPGSGWGGDDVADVAAVVTAALAHNPDLDAARVGVMGGSYGGLVTSMMLAKTDLFAAGWAERGPYNLLSDAATKDEAPWFFEAYLGTSHLTDPESYWLASPLRYVADITAPLMIVHSEQDYRCAIGQAEELFFALKVLGREVEFLRFPGENHGLTRNGHPVHRFQRLELLLEWFGRHLRL